MSPADSTRQEVLALNQKLLDSIARGDWDTYNRLCDPGLTAFEPETKGQLIAGMDFHRFFFDLGGNPGPCTTTMASPCVWMLGDDAAVVCYTRVVQKLDADGQPVIRMSEETRVWQRRDGQWRHIHFHRSCS